MLRHLFSPTRQRSCNEIRLYTLRLKPRALQASRNWSETCCDRFSNASCQRWLEGLRRLTELHHQIKTCAGASDIRTVLMSHVVALRSWRPTLGSTLWVLNPETATTDSLLLGALSRCCRHRHRHHRRHQNHHPNIPLLAMMKIIVIHLHLHMFVHPLLLLLLLLLLPMVVVIVVISIHCYSSVIDARFRHP